MIDCIFGVKFDRSLKRTPSSDVFSIPCSSVNRAFFFSSSFMPTERRFFENGAFRFGWAGNSYYCFSFEFLRLCLLILSPSSSGMKSLSPRLETSLACLLLTDACSESTSEPSCICSGYLRICCFKSLSGFFMGSTVSTESVSSSSVLTFGPSGLKSVLADNSI